MTPRDPDPLPGQMTVEECIEVAEKGLDGKPSAREYQGRALTAAEVARRRTAEAIHRKEGR
jgi:hypothetical protein